MSDGTRAATRRLRADARRLGIATSWRSVDDVRHEVSDETVRALLDAMAAAPGAGGLDAVTVAWDGADPVIRPVDPGVPTPAAVEVRTEVGLRTVLTGRDDTIERLADGGIRLRVDLPVGVHTARVPDGELAGTTVTILAAPSRLGPVTDRRWGVFAPVHALHDRAGRADLGCLRRLTDWAAEAGAAVVGTLPLLATFLDDPCDESPYAPVSRRWWNELWIELDAVPELAGVGPTAVGDRHLDHAATMAARRAHLEAAAARVSGARAAAQRDFETRHPEVVRYARFRAAVEVHGPERGRAVPLDRTVDADRERHHRYVQFVADEQLASLAHRLASRGQALYLDLPVGTHPLGFDVRADPDGFVAAATTGAPPDAFFPHGQDWGFRPPHPVGMRRNGYRDLRGALARHLAIAPLLRLDHVMALHRLWWIPRDQGPAAGAYVRYPTDELFAVVCIEAHRAGATVVGENLGTVAPAIDRGLARHRLRGMFVGQFGVDPAAEPPLARPPRRAVASIDTHDTATFAGFWTGADIAARRSVDAIDEVTAQRERRGRAAARRVLRTALLEPHRDRDPDLDPATQRAVLRAWTREQAGSPAELVLVTLEDAWLETDPQNIPGTTAAEHRNWSRRLDRSTDELATDPDVAAIVAAAGASGRGRELGC